MSWISDLFKGPKKVNLTPDIQPQMPSQVNPGMYNTLSDLAKNYSTNKGTGFGEDWLSRTTNPAIAQSNARFNEQTVPFLSSQLSKRGIARSAGAGLATDVLGKAEQSQRRDIDSMVADFYRLNEIQKKSDQQFGAGLGQNILAGDVNAQANQAAASERLAGVTAADARQREALQQKKTAQMLQIAGMAAGPLTAGLGGGIASLLGGIGMGNLASALSPLGQGINKFAQGTTDVTKTQLADDEKADFLKYYMLMKGIK